MDKDLKEFLMVKNMPLAKNAPETTGAETVQFDEAKLVMQIMQERYEATEAILKKYGLNWTQYGQMRQRVADSFPDEGIQREGFRVVVQRDPIKQMKQENVQIIGHKSRLTIHRR